jgi:hypothetical protein
VTPAAPIIAERASGERQHEALRQHLADDAPAAGADRKSHRHLPLPGRAAGQQQVGDVCAHDEQDDRDGGEEDAERGAKLRDHPVLQALYLESRPVQPRRVGGPRRPDRAADDIGLVAGDWERHTRAQVGDQRGAW